MKFNEYKLEFTLVFIVMSSIIGVILWFTLDFFNIDNSIELAIISSVAMIMVLITYSLHGKGLLPKPNNQKNRENLIYNYTRKKIRKIPFKRKKYSNVFIRKEKFRKN